MRKNYIEVRRFFTPLGRQARSNSRVMVRIMGGVRGKNRLDLTMALLFLEKT